MPQESENDKTRRESTEKAVREAAAQIAAERSARQAAEGEAREAVTKVAAEQEARQAAERETREAVTKVAAEREARLAAEQAARDAIANAANEKTARKLAENAAREAAAHAASERAAREEADTAAREAFAKAEVEHAARESAEKVAQDAVAKASIAKPQSPAAVAAVAAPPASAQQHSVEPAKTGPGPTWLVPLIIFAVAGLLFWMISGQWTNWENSWSVKTDDAYIRADATPLSTKVVGTVAQTRVKDFEPVKRGELLVELKNDDYKAQVEQAQAAVREAQTKLSDMKQRKEQQDAQVLDAQSAAESGRAGVQEADDGIAASGDSIEEAKAGIDAASAAITQCQAAVKAATADAKRAALERERQEGLLSDESTTREKAELAIDESDRAIANLEAQKAAEAKARAELAARRAQLEKAKQQLSTSHAERTKSLASVRSRESEVTAQRKLRELLDGEERQLTADLALRNAALHSAQVNLDYTIVRAPEDGVVGELKVKPGQLVSAGTQVITIVSSTPWVIANYLETQLVKVKPGDVADIDVDALPGTHLKGHVEAIAPASGAQFSLLPPDNASGNFTKVTQRIAVKIVFDESQQNLTRLRPGMSAITTIRPGSSK